MKPYIKHRHRNHKEALSVHKVVYQVRNWYLPKAIVMLEMNLECT